MTFRDPFRMRWSVPPRTLDRVNIDEGERICGGEAAVSERLSSMQQAVTGMAIVWLSELCCDVAIPFRIPGPF